MLRSLAFRGIPNEVRSLRRIVWYVLIGYLPCETHKWEQHLKSHKKLYDDWESTLIIRPELRPNEPIGVSSVGIEYGNVKDHPLNNASESKWSQYFADQELWTEIEKDIKRTRSDLNFFTNARDPAKRHLTEQLKVQQQSKKADLCGDQRLNYIETHSDVLARILFIYAKLNPGVKYVQGMNEILATLYYCFYDPKYPQDFVSEPDLFFCFNVVISGVRDSFLRTMDAEDTGINGKVSEFSFLLFQVDPVLHDHLAELGMNPQFYSLRWLMLLMSQEFEINNVIRLWDLVFADHDKFTFVYFVCVAMVTSRREQLLKGDFSDCMQLLQTQLNGPDPQIIYNITNHAKKICLKVTRKYENYIEVEFQNQK